MWARCWRDVGEVWVRCGRIMGIEQEEEWKKRMSVKENSAEVLLNVSL